MLPSTPPSSQQTAAGRRTGRAGWKKCIKVYSRSKASLWLLQLEPQWLHVLLQTYKMRASIFILEVSFSICNVSHPLQMSRGASGASRSFSYSFSFALSFSLSPSSSSPSSPFHTCGEPPSGLDGWGREMAPDAPRWPPDGLQDGARWPNVVLTPNGVQNCPKRPQGGHNLAVRWPPNLLRTPPENNQGNFADPVWPVCRWAQRFVPGGRGWRGGHLLQKCSQARRNYSKWLQMLQLRPEDAVKTVGSRPPRIRWPPGPSRGGVSLPFVYGTPASTGPPCKFTVTGPP